MRVRCTGMNGLLDATTALYMSKRTWNDARGIILASNYSAWISTPRKEREKHPDDYPFDKEIDKLCKYGKKHITLLKFVDFGFLVEDIHRGAQDDWDSHAKRFDNRIIRASTRLADFEKGEMSDYYKDKILTDDQAADILKMTFPDKIHTNDHTYVRAVNGYVLEEYADNRDVKRGLYMLSIPSDFIFRVNLAEFAHIYKLRNEHSGANPEVKELCETCADLIENKVPQFNRDFLLSVDN